MSFWDFWKNFPTYVAPFNPLAAVLAPVLGGAICGAMGALLEGKNRRTWARLSAVLYPIFVILGGMISAELKKTPGSGLWGMFIGNIVAAVVVIVAIIRTGPRRPANLF